MSQSIPRARHLRRTQTSAEAKLWRVPRNRALNGWTFRRQRPIDRCGVDSVWIEAKRGVDVDGATHSTERALVSDAARATIVETCGFALFCLLNADIHQDPDGVRETLWVALPPSDPVRSPHPPNRAR